MTRTAPPISIEIPDLIAGYRHGPGDGYGQDVGYDECVDRHGSIRPAWRPMLASFSAMSRTDLADRARRMDRRVRETGIAYDIFADPTKSAQRWQLDLMPLIISSGEWRFLEQALIQRARLFDSLLADIYATQDTMRRGLIPAELIFSDPSYLRPCQSVLPTAGPLQFYAADIARGADGLWRVIDNHTETNAGIGFALANRVVHTHVAGDVFKAANGVRLAQYFQAMQTALTQHSGRDNARIALLTPGPHHEDYFSHAYLARYLGYLLVDGNDLRTKGSEVYLKTLEGLKEVDLIVRCVDGRSIDPLELDPGGFDGPAGLLRAWRKSPHLVVNAIGSAVVQNRGLGSYLPALCRDILGEDLHLADAPRIWLGDIAGRARVAQNFDNVVIRKAQEGTGRPGRAALGQNASTLDADSRAILEREIALHGARLVAEEKIGFSTAPVFTAAGLAPRPFAVRMFVARTAQGYQVMPGGLAMSVDPHRAVALTAPDGHTRDVWVISETEQAPHVSLWRPTVENARVQRSQRVIQSRVADDLFWLGRYCERADWTMRVVRSALRRVEEDSGPATGRRAARRCLEMLLPKDKTAKAGDTPRPDDDEIERLSALILSGKQGLRTLDRTCSGLFRVANLARDRLSHEAWHTLTKFRPGDTWAKALGDAAPVAALDYLEEGLAAVSAFNGLMHENMTRNYGWSFLDMGRRLERAYNLCEAIDTLFVPATEAEDEASSLMLLLELADSFITYRSRYRLDPMLALVLDLLLLDETNPRSLAYQLAAISDHMSRLPDNKHATGLTDDRRMGLALLTATRLADVAAIAQDDDRQLLSQLMTQHLESLPELSNAVARHYFNLMDDVPQRVHTRTDQPRGEPHP